MARGLRRHPPHPIFHRPTQIQNGPTTVGSSFTADAVVKAEETGTFTADAVISGRALTPRNGLYSWGWRPAKRIAPQQLRKTSELAVAVVTQSGSFVADAVILRTQSGSFTADAIIKKTMEVGPRFYLDTFTDADNTQLENHISDSGHVWLEPGIYDTRIVGNEVVSAGSPGDHRAQASPIAQNVELRFDATIPSFGSVLNVWARYAVGPLTGWVFIWEDVGEGNVAYLISYSESGSGGSVESTVSMDTSTHSIRFRATGNSASFYVDGVYIGSHTLNPAHIPIPSGGDIALKVDGGATFDNLEGFPAFAFQADSVIVAAPAPLPSNHNITTNGRWRPAKRIAPQQRRITVPPPSEQSGSFTADAVISARVLTPKFNLTALGIWRAAKRIAPQQRRITVLQPAEQTGSFTADAVIQREQTGSFTADAVVLRTATGSFTADAVITLTFAGSFTADAVIRREQTGSFTVDAVLKREQTGSFTADADIKREITGSFTADAVITLTFSGTFTADAVVKREQSGSFTADAIIKRTIGGPLFWDTFTDGTSVELKDHTPDIGGSWVHVVDTPNISPFDTYGLVDSSAVTTIQSLGTKFEIHWLFAQPASGATLQGVTFYNTDASNYWSAFFRSQAMAAGFRLNKIEAGVESNILLVQATYTGTSRGRVNVDGTHFTFYVDEVLVGDVIDASLAATTTVGVRTQNFGATTGLDELGVWTTTSIGEGGAVDLIGAFRADAVIVRDVFETQRNTTAQRTWRPKHRIRPEPQRRLHPDALAVIQTTPKRNITALGIWRSQPRHRPPYRHILNPTEFSVEQSGSLTADAIVLREQTGSFTADAAINTATSGQITVDAVIFATISGSFTSDAEIIGPTLGARRPAFRQPQRLLPAAQRKLHPTQFTVEQSGSFTADAITLREQSSTFTIDAVTLRTQTNSFTADAVIYREQVGSFTADAVVFATIFGTFTADAVLRREAAGSFTADAVITLSTTGQFTADAEISARVLTPKSNLTGLNIWRAAKRIAPQRWLPKYPPAEEHTGAFTADAVIQREQTGSLTADAVTQREQTGSFTADAVVRQTRSFAVTADGVVHRVTSASLTADAIIYREQTGSFTADAFLNTEGVFTFSADAVIQVVQDETFTADAVIDWVARAVWTTPVNTVEVSTTPTLAFIMPTSFGPMHFHIQLDKVSTFDGANLREHISFEDLTGWEYWDGAVWQPVTLDGVPNSFSGNEARYTLQTPLTAGTWYRRVRTGSF